MYLHVYIYKCIIFHWFHFYYQITKGAKKKQLIRLALAIPPTRPLSVWTTEGSLELPSKTTPGESINVTCSWWPNPSEKYARQIGFIFPKFWGENNKYSKPPPSIALVKLRPLKRDLWVGITGFSGTLIYIIIYIYICLGCRHLSYLHCLHKPTPDPAMKNLFTCEDWWVTRQDWLASGFHDHIAIAGMTSPLK